MNATVLITGATRGLGLGLGLEVSRQLAQQGATVLISGRDREQTVSAARVLSDAGDVRALEVDLDVTEQESVDAAAAALAKVPGRLDVLVNNAAAYVDWNELASAADLATAAQVINVNLFGAWRMTKALLPLLRASDHPRVVNVSSGAGSHGDDQFGLTKRGGAAASYGISKAAAQRAHQHARDRAGRHPHPDQRCLPRLDGHLARRRTDGSPPRSSRRGLDRLGCHPP